jgi:hypothetical protein
MPAICATAINGIAAKFSARPANGSDRHIQATQARRGYKQADQFAM